MTGCDISWIGGNLQSGIGTTTRWGDGVELYGNATNFLVDDCKIWQIYDGAFGSQMGGGMTQTNVAYRNNIVWDCEAGTGLLELSSNDSMSYTYIENNVFAYSGYGWSHAVRPDPQGTSIDLLDSYGTFTNTYIRNNICYESTEVCLRVGQDFANPTSITLDNNLYYQNDPMQIIYWWAATGKTSYGVEQFAQYQSDHPSEDVHSLAPASGPMFADPANDDFHLLANSPAINAGCNTANDAYNAGAAADFSGLARPQGEAYDIGAYEYQDLPVQAGLQANWRLDETTVGTVVDSYGGNNGTNNAATVNQPGKINTAYDFNGSTSYVAVPCMNYDQLTISAWFYRDAKDTVNADAIWGGWDWNSNVQLQQGYDLRFAPNSDAIEFDLVTQTSGGVKTCNVCYASLGNSLGQWFYVAATYDAAAGAADYLCQRRGRADRLTAGRQHRRAADRL